MALTHTYTIGWAGSGNAAQRITVPITGDGEDIRQVSVPPGTTDMEIDVDFLVAALRSFFANATGPADGTVITLKTNSTSTPGDTLTFTKPGGIVYITAYLGENPFTVDVTKMYASNPSSTETATLNLCVLQDSTP